MTKMRVSKITYEEIDVQLPYYYCHRLDYSAQIYGRIAESGVVEINESEGRYEITKTQSIDNHECYLKQEHRSTKSAFDNSAGRVRAFLSCEVDNE